MNSWKWIVGSILSTSLISSAFAANMDVDAIGPESIKIYNDEKGSMISLWGRFEGGVSNYDTAGNLMNFSSSEGYNPEKQESEMGSYFVNRFAIAGQHVVNDYFSIIGRGEYEIRSAVYNYAGKGAQNSELFARDVYVGIASNNFGRIKIGRMDSNTQLFTDMVDIFTMTGAKTFGNRASLIDNSADALFRRDGTIQYELSAAGVDFGVSYSTPSEQIEYGYSATIRYNLDMKDFGVLRPVATLYYSKKNEDRLQHTVVMPSEKSYSGAVSDYMTYGVGFGYDVSSLHVGFTYIIEELGVDDTMYDHNATLDDIYKDLTNYGFEFAVSYTMAEKYKIMANYMNLSTQKYLNDDGAYDNGTLINEIGLEFDYMFNDLSFLYVSYSVRLNDAKVAGLDGLMYGDNNYAGSNSADEPENAIAFGVRYEF